MRGYPPRRHHRHPHYPLSLVSYQARHDWTILPLAASPQGYNPNQVVQQLYDRFTAGDIEGVASEHSAQSLA